MKNKFFSHSDKSTSSLATTSCGAQSSTRGTRRLYPLCSVFILFLFSFIFLNDPTKTHAKTLEEYISSKPFDNYFIVEYSYLKNNIEYIDYRGLSWSNNLSLNYSTNWSGNYNISSIQNISVPFQSIHYTSPVIFKDGDTHIEIKMLPSSGQESLVAMIFANNWSTGSYNGSVSSDPINILNIYYSSDRPIFIEASSYANYITSGDSSGQYLPSSSSDSSIWTWSKKTSSNWLDFLNEELPDLWDIFYKDDEQYYKFEITNPSPTPSPTPIPKYIYDSQGNIVYTYYIDNSTNINESYEINYLDELTNIENNVVSIESEIGDTTISYDFKLDLNSPIGELNKFVFEQEDAIEAVNTSSSGMPSEFMAYISAAIAMLLIAGLIHRFLG